MPISTLAARFCLALCLAILTFATANAQTIPRPRDDPFYTPTSGYQDLPNGSVLRERKINAQYLIGLFSTDVTSVLGEALGDKIELLKNLKIDAYQVLYKSTDGHGQPVAEAATVLLPQGPYLGKGSRPLIAYANAIDGTSDRCWPSYTMRVGLLTPNTIGAVAAYDMGETLVALLSGYAVVYTDYEGPQSQMAAGPQAGHGVLDGIRAVLDYAPAGLDKNTKVGLLGYSGGGGAAGWAAALHSSYAPELNIVGAAIGAPNGADVKQVYTYLNGKPTAGALAALLAGINRAYPEAGLDAYLNEAGHKLIADLSDACLVESSLQHADAGRFEQYTVQPAVPFERSAPGQFLFKANSLVDQPLVPDMPVLIYGDVFDELWPIKAGNDLALKYCKAGAEVEVMHTFTPTPLLALVHIAGEIEGTLPSLGYLANRIEGKAPRNDCGAGSANVWSSTLPLPYYPFLTQ